MPKPTERQKRKILDAVFEPLKSEPPVRSSGEEAPARPICSSFRAWFEAQCGKRPRPRTMDDDLRENVRLGTLAAELLLRARVYDEKEAAALYAWRAKDHSEKEIMRRLLNAPGEPPAREIDTARSSRKRG